MTTEVVKNSINCFQINSTSADDQVVAQSLLPDLEGFLRLDNEFKNDQDCQKWSKEEIVEDKVNRYTMWIKEVEGVIIPVHYEMKGYNNLLGSHYDHYFVSMIIILFPMTISPLRLRIPPYLICSSQ